MAITHEVVKRWVCDFAGEIAENKQMLTKLDSAIGDGDHGTNMDRGMQAVVTKLEDVSGDDVGGLLKTVGMTLVSKIGGAGGPLYGTFFIQMGTATAGKTDITAEDWSAALDSGVNGVQARGKAELEDKTMLDALIPAREAFKEALEAGASFQESLERSAQAADEGMKATIPLVARKGRASYLGERSAGHQDPGATSSHMLMRTAAQALAQGTS
ncbi:dihydroxyacetone kinase subunit DhaL [soil metagenome]